MVVSWELVLGNTGVTVHGAFYLPELKDLEHMRSAFESLDMNVLVPFFSSQFVQARRTLRNINEKQREN